MPDSSGCAAAALRRGRSRAALPETPADGRLQAVHAPLTNPHRPAPLTRMFLQTKAVPHMHATAVRDWRNDACICGAWMQPCCMTRLPALPSDVCECCFWRPEGPVLLLLCRRSVCDPCCEGF